MKKNDRFTVTIEDETNLGYGVTHIDGMTVFVANALPHEVMEIQILKVKNTYTYARYVNIITPSLERTKVKCEVAHQCGGCQLQHRTYDSQCSFKQAQIEKLFPNEIVKEIISAQHPWYYRNKAQFPVQIKDGQVKIGFYRNHSNDIIENADCCIQSKAINDIYQFLKENLSVEEAEGLRHILMRSNSKQELQLVFIGTKNLGWKSLITKLTDSHPNVNGILFNKNQRNDNVILGDEYKVLWGNERLPMECMNNQISLSFQSFFQVNTEQMERLYQCVLEAGQFQPTDHVIEFYSGTGTIGMSVANQVKKVTGVEIEPKAVEDAKENCRINGITNCEYICQDATEFAREMAERKEEVDAVIVDPPRKGCTKQGILDMTGLNPEKIIYVSCNPVTLKRDLEIFKSQGYQCQWIQPVDMFPQTIHVETVCLLSQRKPDTTIEVDLDISELEVSSAETKATYEEIKPTCWKNTG